MQPIEAALAQAIELFNAGQLAQAEQRVSALLQRDGAHPALHQLMAVLRMEQRQWDAAREHIARSLAARPQHLPSLQIAAQIAQRSGDAAGARRALEELLRLQPASPVGWFALSLACHELRDHDAEAAALQRTLALQPEHVQALVNLGIVQQERGDLQAAMSSYARAYRLRSDTFGRIANALCSERSGALWLDLDALREALRAASNS
jgi:predicted Zn-dependent protease